MAADDPLHRSGAPQNRPATPSAMKRACHAHTTGFDLPDRRMISAVPQPSAVARSRSIKTH
jgi:hypothetical protein